MSDATLLRSLTRTVSSPVTAFKTTITSVPAAVAEAALSKRRVSVPVPAAMVSDVFKFEPAKINVSLPEPEVRLSSPLVVLNVKALVKPDALTTALTEPESVIVAIPAACARESSV